MARKGSSIFYVRFPACITTTSADICRMPPPVPDDKIKATKLVYDCFIDRLIVHIIRTHQGRML